MRSSRRALILSLVLGSAVLVAAGVLVASFRTTPAAEPGATPGAAPTPAVGVPGPGRYPNLAPDPALAEFVDACERGVSRWQPGQLDYPERIPVDLGRSVTYVASVDIRQSPLPPDQVLSASDALSSPIAVQCALSARLVPVGTGVEVAEREFVLRRFRPSGVVNWSWSIKAAELGSHQLRLELQPAVTFGDPAGGDPTGRLGGPVTASAFVSEVRVSGTLPERAGRWADRNVALLGAIALLVTGAVLALVRFSGRLGEARRARRGRRTGKR